MLSPSLGQYDPNTDYKDFCGEHVLDFSSINMKEADFLIDALREGEKFSAILSNVFKDDLDQMARTAAYAFSIGKITREQTASVLEYRMMIEAFWSNGVEEIEILDTDGDYTEEAHRVGGFLENHTQFTTLQALLKNKPRSEHRAFILTLPRMMSEQLPEFLQLTTQLKVTIKDSNVSEPHIILPSVGVRNALTETIYGKNAKLLFPRLGLFTINDIERSMRLGGRYAAVAYPGIDSPLDFHGLRAHPFYIGLHDEAHRRLISTIRNTAYEAFFYAIDVLRSLTNIHWSKEIWDGVDMEIGLFVNEYAQDTMSDFLGLLSAPVYTQQRLMGLFNASPYNDTTWLLLIHMVLHEDEWKKREIFPSKFEQYSIRYGKLINFIKLHKNEIEKETSPAKQAAILKCKYLGIEIVNKESICLKKVKGNYIQLEMNHEPIVHPKALCVQMDIQSEYPYLWLKFLQNLKIIAKDRFNTVFDLDKFKVFYELIKNKYSYTGIFDEKNLEIVNRPMSYFKEYDAYLNAIVLFNMCDLDEIKDFDGNIFDVVVGLLAYKKLANEDVLHYFNSELFPQLTMAASLKLNLNDYNIRSLIKKEKLTLAKLPHLAAPVIQLITTTPLTTLVERDKLTIAKLSQLSKELIQLIKRRYISNLLQEGQVSIAQLESLSPATIKILTLRQTEDSIDNNEVTVQELITRLELIHGLVASVAQQGIFARASVAANTVNINNANVLK
jgi:hypothetical protein